MRHGDHWIARAGDRELRLSNLTKVFWPENGYTKGDLLTYYFNISPTMLPHVAERPLTLKRMPEGVGALYFYEKDVPSYTPEWMPTLEIEAETQDRTIRFATVTDVASLLWLANIGCIELHPHFTKGTQQTHPTYAVFDLDPFPPAGLDEVRNVASHLKVVLDRLGLSSYPKTSGATGLQIYVPLDGKHTYAEVRGFVGVLCGMVHQADPDTTTMEWEIAKRAGKVFLDANMNRAGASLASAYSLRPKEDAPVSLPFEWGELDDIDPYQFTIATVFDRITEAGDPFLGLAESKGHSLTKPMDDLDTKPRTPRR